MKPALKQVMMRSLKRGHRPLLSLMQSLLLCAVLLPAPAALAAGLQIQRETERHLLEALAEDGYPMAQAQLSLVLNTGYGTAVAAQRARLLLAAALAAGNPLAQVLSCQAGREADPNASLALCEQALPGLTLLAPDEPYARYGLGVYYRLKGEAETAKAWLEQSVDELPLAWVELGRLHEAGLLIEESVALEASACYRQAAELEIAEGMFALGRILAEGIDDQDHSQEARHWLEQAAVRGHPGAIQALEALP